MSVSRPQSWRDSAKGILVVVYVVAFAGALGYINAFYFNFEKLIDSVLGLIEGLFLVGFIGYVFWVGLKTVLRGKDDSR